MPLGDSSKNVVIPARLVAAVTLANSRSGGPREIITAITAAIVKALDDSQCGRYIDSTPIFDANDQVMIGFGLKPGVPAEREHLVRGLAANCYAGMEAALQAAGIPYTPDQGNGILSFDQANFAAAILPVVTQQAADEKKLAAQALFSAGPSINRQFVDRLNAQRSPAGAKGAFKNSSRFIE